ncbi:hypothetical protein ARC20_06135 [Stenotrophomonas panacihumi]|uniref:Tetratricopeptide repeat protein n=1 Tax=Stenotrophomonas panacihumi TaxID=676599 RepID=A0A0R0AL35_9GAMM|nr:hypothetical protein [Stenotrophomonas panacihumi]KRG45984.1 hypothetical protein ARC20_06135 [Stenotrophomonas panacihumi]PTN56350.1 hypothetical protein C9J98_01125 [Stenotrophomonas panacihumi]
MRLYRWQTLPLLLLLLTAPALARPAAPPAPDFATQLQAVARSLDGAPNAEGQAAMERMLADPRFEALDPPQQAAALAVAGWSALGLERIAQARTLLERASVIEPSVAEIWYMRAVADHQGGERELAARHLAKHIGASPKTLPELDAGVVYAFLRDTAPGGEARRVLLQALFDANWTIGGTAPTAEWYELAVLQYEAGERAALPATLARIDSSDGMVRLRTDRRFDAWVDRAAPRWNVRHALEQEQDALRVTNLLNPEDMSVLVNLAATMLSLGDYEEVLRMSGQVDAVVEAAQAQNAQPPYTHMDQFLWLMENRVSALRRLGRSDEALALRQRLGQMPEQGQRNVSQALNLGEMLVGLQRPKEALDAIATLGDASPYGEMVAHMLHLLAARQMHDEAAATQALDYLRAHSADAPRIWLTSLLLIDAQDEAAAFVRTELASPLRRGDMLFDLQDQPEPEPLPAFAPLEPRAQALKKRADVRAAIDAVGRVERYDVEL